MAVAGRAKAAFPVKSLRAVVVFPHAKPQCIRAAIDSCCLIRVHQQVRKAGAIKILQNIQPLQFYGPFSLIIKRRGIGFPLRVTGYLPLFIAPQKNKHAFIFQ